MVAPASLAALEMAKDTEPIPPSTYLIFSHLRTERKLNEQYAYDIRKMSAARSNRIQSRGMLIVSLL